MAQGYYLDELIKREIYSQAVFLGLINSVAREPPPARLGGPSSQFQGSGRELPG